MKKRRFERILMKNTCAMLFPVLVIISALIFLGIRYSLFQAVTCYTLTDAEPMSDQIARLYENGDTCISCKVSEMYYTGYDYLTDGKVSGAYYYSFEDDHMQIYLVGTKNPADTVRARTIKGRIISDEVITGYIVSGLAENGSISMDILNGFYDSYVVSEPDYPYVYARIGYILIAAIAVVYVFVLSGLVNVWMHPYKHPQAKKLRVFGQKSAVIAWLNREMRESLFFRYHGIYVTQNFLIYSRALCTDVIKLDDVRYLSKNLVGDEKRRQRYRLTLSEPETDLFYEIDFHSEKMIDACVAAIRGQEET